MFKFNCMYNGDLERILMYAANRDIANLDEWKALLPLLGVCQQWTRILYPVVFHSAFIHYAQYRGQMSGKLKRWESNIDCIAIRSCYTVVKRLEIYIAIPVDELLVLQHIEKLLQLDTIDWSQIRTLYIIIDGHYIEKLSRIPNKVVASIVEFAQILIVQMPNIIDLQIQQHHEGYAMQSLPQALINAYSLQLKQLVLNPVVTLPTFDLGSSLTHLNLCFYPEYDYEYNLSVFAETLYNLRLTCLPFNTPWYMFYGNSRKGLINFKNLHELNIQYHPIEYKNKYGQRIKPFPWNQIPKTDKSPRKCITSISGTQYRYKLIFPKLKVLKVYDCFEEPDIINAKFGCTLDLFNLDGDLEKIEKWSAIQLKTHRFKVIPRLYFGKHTAADIEILNNLFSKPGNHNARELYFLGRKSHTQVSLFFWNYVNILVVHLDSLALLLELLPRMPRLSKLTCQFFGIENTAKSTEEVSQNFNLYIDTPAFALRLEELHLHAENELECGYNYLAIVYNLITRTELLTILTVPKKILSTVQKIIDAQKLTYPHFANMGVDGN